MVFSAAGVYTGRNNSLNKAYAILQVSATNQKAELEAAILGVQTAMSIKANTEAGYTISRFVIRTDSRYVFDCTTKHIRRWKIMGWMTAGNTPVANQELWKKLESAIEEVESRKKANVLFWWFPRTYNKEADFQANEGFNAMKRYN
ncbi:hypothetical protein LTR64_000082 [Lithohypha guttulata]|uniref:uncharacterized protein n=1 Tax=Lithohypha guttulata TaxID=1690604 RepID=UPI002DE17634|nr:hypothetical protein LTR51_007444 [Lithohypha guttulata]